MDIPSGSEVFYFFTVLICCIIKDHIELIIKILFSQKL